MIIQRIKRFYASYKHHRMILSNAQILPSVHELSSGANNTDILCLVSHRNIRLLLLLLTCLWHLFLSKILTVLDKCPMWHPWKHRVVVLWLLLRNRRFITPLAEFYLDELADPNLTLIFNVAKLEIDWHLFESSV